MKTPSRRLSSRQGTRRTSTRTRADRSPGRGISLRRAVVLRQDLSADHGRVAVVPPDYPLRRLNHFPRPGPFTEDLQALVLQGSPGGIGSWAHRQSRVGHGAPALESLVVDNADEMTLGVLHDGIERCKRIP